MAHDLRRHHGPRGSASPRSSHAVRHPAASRSCGLKQRQKTRRSRRVSCGDSRSMTTTKARRMQAKLWEFSGDYFIIMQDMYFSIVTTEPDLEKPALGANRLQAGLCEACGFHIACDTWLIENVGEHPSTPPFCPGNNKSHLTTRPWSRRYIPLPSLRFPYDADNLGWTRNRRSPRS